MLVLGKPEKGEVMAGDLLAALPVRPVNVESMERGIHLYNDWKAYREIHSIIRKFNPDIVHTHGSKPGTLGRIAAHRLNVPVIVHTFHGHVFHSYFSPVKTRFYLMLERVLARITDRIIALSNHQKKELSNNYRIAGAEKFAVVPIGIDLEKFYTGQERKRIAFRDAYGLTEEEIAIGIVGRLVPVKNHIMFLDAVSLIKSQTQLPVKAFVVGDGEMRQKLEHYCREKGLNPYGGKETVVFTSWKENVDVVYAGLDVVCLTSLNEGTPVSVIEAQAAGKPVVSTICGGIHEVVRAGETAFLTPSNETGQFAKHLLRLCENNALREKMGENARALMSTQIDAEKMARLSESVYRSLLNPATENEHRKNKITRFSC